MADVEKKKLARPSPSSVLDYVQVVKRKNTEIHPNDVTVESDFVWNEDQQAAITSVLAGKNTFITGPGGSGKSALLQHIIKALLVKHGGGGQAVQVCATTGIAALHLRGSTVHSFAGVGLANEPAEELIVRLFKNARALYRWRMTKVLIIDEISMLHIDFFEKLDAIAKAVRKAKNLPFGGIQLVVAGDFFQLPPIVARRDTTEVGPDETPAKKYIFQSHLWSTTIETMIGLKHIYRQKDYEFMQLLNRFRYGILNEEDIAVLNSRVVPNAHSVSDISKSTFLFARKDPAADHNMSQLNNIRAESVSFSAIDWASSDDVGASSALQALQRDCPASATVVLKPGALVVLLKNISVVFGLVNGSRGIVLESHEVYSGNETANSNATDGVIVSSDAEQDDDDDIDILPTPPATPQHLTPKNDPMCFACVGMPAVTVKFDNGVVATIGPSTWTVERPGPFGRVPICSRTQVPFNLAWALSIHKSQGMTLDSACVALNDLFEPGQGYVACGRLTHLQGLTIIGNFNPGLLVADRTVVEFYEHNRL